MLILIFIIGLSTKSSNLLHNYSYSSKEINKKSSEIDDYENTKSKTKKN